MSSTTTMTSGTTSTSTASPTCVSMAPGKDGYLPPEACGNILLYVPSFGAAIFFTLLFGLTTLIHGVQIFVYRKKYAWVVMMGGVWETISMILRTLLVKQQNNADYDTYHQLFFLLAPLWVNAFLYMTFGRMVWFFSQEERLGGLYPQRFGTIFVWLDIVSFLVQLAGAGMSSQTNTSSSIIQTGLHVYMGGIGLQEFFILGFSALMVQLHMRLLRQDREGVMLSRLQNGSLPWRWLFYGIYFTLVMITVRIIFRLAEYAQGTNVSNPVLTHEAYTYVLDALPMFLALAVLNFTHPGRIINGPQSSWPRLSRKQKKEMKRQKQLIRDAGGMTGGGLNTNDMAYQSLAMQDQGRVSADRPITP